MRRKRKKTQADMPEITDVPQSADPLDEAAPLPQNKQAKNDSRKETGEADTDAPQEPPTATGNGRKRKRRRKKRAAATPDHAGPATETDLGEAVSDPAEQVGEAADPVAEPAKSGRKRRRRRKKSAGSAATAVEGPTQEARTEPSDRASEERPASEAEDERPLPASEAAKPRKRRRKRRRSGAGQSAPPSLGEVKPKARVVWPDEKPAGEAGAIAYSPQRADEAAPEPRIVWPDEKPSGQIQTADRTSAPATDVPPPEPDPAEASSTDEVVDDGPNEAAGTRGAKVCLYCGESKPLGDFLRRTGKKSGTEARRGACRDCRKRRSAVGAGTEAASDPLPPPLAAGPTETLGTEDEIVDTTPKRRFRRPLPEPPEDALLEPTREAELRTTRQGTVRMRGRTDKGRRWQQETDLEMARCLVREHAAVVVNRFTIRRLYTNRSFRRYILERDRYTCHFCGEYGDTIDHLLPRAKGGHTTPLNCVCACMLCNQNKADRDLDEFMEDAEPLDESSDRLQAES